MKNKDLAVFKNVLETYEIEDFLRLMNLVKTAIGKKIANVEIMPGGLTNKNFKVTTEDGTMIAVRVAGKGTAEYINRPAEKHNAGLMASMGIAPEIYYYDSKTGSQIVEYIDKDTMSAEDFKTRPEVVRQSASVMKKVHDSGMEFKGLSDPIKQIRGYAEILKEKGFEERYANWNRILENLNKIEEAYKINPPKLVPCHNDAVAENFMYSNGTMRVTDWEYGGMGDKYYDMACVFVENPLQPEYEEIYLKTYFGEEITEEDRARVLINKFLVVSHWSTWALVQIANGKDYDFYYPHGESRSFQADTFMNDENFDRYLELIK